MLNAGSYQTLKVNRISDFGLFLCDEEGNEVLLPNRYVSLENKVGDMMDVFVYHDSEDRIVATTEKPLGVVGEVVPLKVVDKTVHGAFLDWGLTAKDIFLPNRNMQGRVDMGVYYPVYIYRDGITGRAVASMKFKSFISNQELNLKRGDRVRATVIHSTDGGLRVIINNRHWGMLYFNQLFDRLDIGDTVDAYVRRITEDNRVDLSLQQEGYDEIKNASERLLELLEDHGGSMPIWDGSTPEEVSAATKMSKKVFKRTVGYLMKSGQVEMSEKGIKLIEKESGK